MPKQYYMMGACGMGMAPLCAFLIDDGAKVYGIDHNPNEEIKSKLESIGVIFKKETKLSPDTQIVISSALSRNIDKIKAITQSKKIIRRGECWAEICKNRKLVAVVGSHGKSTVSGLISHAILEKNLDAGYLVGAVPNNFAMHKYCKENKFIVSEIDESDATIEHFYPEITVALNADLDHTDTYADLSKLEDMFLRLFNRTKSLVIYPKNDKILSKIAQKSSVKSIAIDATEDFVSTNKNFAKITLENIFNISIEENVFENFAGLMRRQEILLDVDNLEVIADYAHHPNEVKSFIRWFSQHNDNQKIIIFQPHRYTRTKSFAKEFAEIFDNNKKLAQTYVLPVYPASEPFDADGENSAIKKFSDSIILVKSSEMLKMILDKLNTTSQQKTSIAIVGAGDFYFTAKQFLTKTK